ncbi:MAG: hypothetical protein R3253_14880, partial [Longimicrobiales bacterium]|nr:hypothetical protein [Longimicrobiales bacterium]
VLYEMLAGQPPFHSRTSQATLARHLTDRVPSLKPLREGVPEEVEEAIRTALAKAPSDRFENVDAFASALTRRPTFPTADDEPPKSVTAPTGPFVRSLQLVGILLVVAAVGVAYNAWFGRTEAIAMPDGEYQDSVAMMPLENTTGDPSIDYVGKSVAGQVAKHFQQVSGIKVIGEYSVRSLWERNLGYAGLMDSLDVGHLLEGWIEVRGDELAISVTDTDASGVLENTMIFEPFPRERLDSAIVAIAHAVAVDFLQRHGLSTTGFTGEDAEPGAGSEAYLLANEELGKRSREGMIRAEALLHEAIALDSTYAPAYAALSSVYALSLSYRWDLGIAPFDVAVRSLAYADRAVALDPTNSNGYASRGYALVLLGIDIDAAEADFAQALTLAPNEPSGSSWASRLLAERGQLDEAIAAATRARNADRLQAGRHMALAALELQVGQYPQAIRSAQLAYGLAPELRRAAAREAYALLLLGRPQECLEVELGAYFLVHASCHRVLGNLDAAQQLIDDALRAFNAGRSEGGEYLPDLQAAELAAYYALAGEVDRAARWATEAYTASPVGIDPRVLESEIFDPVRDDERFADALREAQSAARARVVDEWRAHPLASPPAVP